MREVDVNAIRDEADRFMTIGCVGPESVLDKLTDLLYNGPDRYHLAGPEALELIPSEQASQRVGALTNADLFVYAIDTREPLTDADVQAFTLVDRLPVPYIVVLMYGGVPAAGGATLPRMAMANAVVIQSPDALDAADKLATTLLERLPSELHLPAARKLAGLRPAYAKSLVNSTSFTNATYSLASGLPEQIPIVSVPFAAADLLVLTKNQAIMVYRLALAHGAPPDFQARIREVLPVVGGAFLWRQAARTLIGLIPVWGLLPKVAIAYAGTYTTGVAAWRWYSNGELMSGDQLKRLTQEAMRQGRGRAEELINRARRPQLTDNGTATRQEKPGMFARVRNALPWGKKPKGTSTTTDDTP